jgi:hypothetical protein
MTPFLSQLLAFALASVQSSSTQEKTTRKQSKKQSKGHRAPAMANPCHKQNPIFTVLFCYIGLGLEHPTGTQFCQKANLKFKIRKPNDFGGFQFPELRKEKVNIVILGYLDFSV